MTLSYQQNRTGTASIVIQASSNGKTVNDTFKAEVNATYSLQVTGGTGSENYLKGTSVAIVATPPAGKIFSKWTGDTAHLADSGAPTTVVTMPAKHITVTVDAISPTGGTFKQWIGDTDCVTAPDSSQTTLTMPEENVVIKAVFQNTYVTVGSLIDVSSEQVDSGLAEFTSKPRIYAELQNRRIPLRVISPVNHSNPAQKVQGVLQ